MLEPTPAPWNPSALWQGSRWFMCMDTFEKHWHKRNSKTSSLCYLNLALGMIHDGWQWEYFNKLIIKLHNREFLKLCWYENCFCQVIGNDAWCCESMCSINWGSQAISKCHQTGPISMAIGDPCCDGTLFQMAHHKYQGEPEGEFCASWCPPSRY
jgi:hypothetical protein